MRSVRIADRINSEEVTTSKLLDAQKATIRVAMPGIIQSFDPIEQTVTVIPAIREKLVNEKQQIIDTQIPTIPDVPIVIPRSGGYAITFPIKKGDECLIIFADNCINSWWSLGGIQNMEEYRRHDFSDAFAIIGTFSQPKRISNYSATNLEIKSETADAKITIDVDGNIVLRGKTVTTEEWGV